MKNEVFQESSKKYKFENAVINSYTKREKTLTNTLHYNLNTQIIRNTLNDFNAAFERQLSKALKRMPEYQGKVYRGVILEKKVIEKYVKAKGKVISEPLFLSATKNKDKVYSGNVVFEIISNKAREIEHISNSPNDREVLFDSHSKFKVLGIKEVNEKTIITLKEKV